MERRKVYLLDCRQLSFGQWYLQIAQLKIKGINNRIKITIEYGPENKFGKIILLLFPVLKVPKHEIFDRSDFPDFYTIKSLPVGDFGVKKKKIIKIFRGSFGAAKFLMRIWRRYYFLLWAKKKFSGSFIDHLLLAKAIFENFRCFRDLKKLSKILNSLRACSTFMRTPSIRVRNLRSRWACASETDAFTEHTSQDLVRALSIRISSLRVCSACASETKCGTGPWKI